MASLFQPPILDAPKKIRQVEAQPEVHLHNGVAKPISPPSMTLLHTMKPTAFLFSLLALTASAATLVADDWIELFDGKAFDGWHQAGGKHKYEVVDGMIVGTAVAGEGNAFMTTDVTYQDFELKFEVRLDKRLNSGCQVRSVPVGKSGHLRGPQVEIAGGRTGFFYGEIASLLSYIRKTWTDAEADVTAEFVQEVRNGEEGVVGPYEAGELWKTAEPWQSQ